MGYEYTIRGWLKSEGPVHLDVVPPGGIGGYEFAEYDRLELWVRVTGRRRNYVTFATEAKHRSNYYLAAMSAVMASAGGAGGRGLVTVTGERTYDGKDRFVLAEEGNLLTLPTARLYDPLSPWNAVYRWTHYMGRPVEQLSPADPRHLREMLGGRDSVKGWIELQDWHTAEEDAARIMAESISRDPRLEDGLAFIAQYSEPHVLVGQDDVDPASVVELLADVTARLEGAYGLLYFSGPDERSQIPVAIERGRVLVLPEVSLGPGAERRLLPTPPQAYEGLGNGFKAAPLRSALDLHNLFAATVRAAGGEPVAPHGGWREGTGVSRPCYLFEARGLMCILTANDGQARTNAHEGWPYLLLAFLEGAADPDLLKRRLAELLECLRAAGVEVGANVVWPG